MKEQLARENKAAQDPQHPAELTGLAGALVPGHVFVVDSGMNAETPDQQSCHLSPGDALRLVRSPPEGSAAADLTVASGREGDCPGGTPIVLSLVRVAEMHNSFRAQLDGGMQALRTSQGQSGLPPAPADAIAPPPRPASDLPEENEDVAKSLSEAQLQADGTEKSVSDAAFSNG